MAYHSILICDSTLYDVLFYIYYYVLICRKIRHAWASKYDNNTLNKIVFRYIYTVSTIEIMLLCDQIYVFDIATQHLLQIFQLVHLLLIHTNRGMATKYSKAFVNVHKV